MMQTLCSCFRHLLIPQPLRRRKRQRQSGSKSNITMQVILHTQIHAYPTSKHEAGSSSSSWLVLLYEWMKECCLAMQTEFKMLIQIDDDILWHVMMWEMKYEGSTLRWGCGGGATTSYHLAALSLKGPTWGGIRPLMFGSLIEFLIIIIRIIVERSIGFI